MDNLDCIGSTDRASDAVGIGKQSEIMVDFGKKEQNAGLWQRIVLAKGCQVGKVDLADKDIGVLVALVIDILRIIHTLRQSWIAPKARRNRIEFFERFGKFEIYRFHLFNPLPDNFRVPISCP